MTDPRRYRLNMDTGAMGQLQDRIDAIRAQIADGTYETLEKLEIAVGRVLEEELV